MDAAIEHYAPEETRGDTPTVSLTLPVVVLPTCLHMQVRSGSKTKNLVPFVLKRLLPPDGTLEQVTWNAFGDAIGKAIACAELLKRRAGIELHQHVQIGYKRVEQVWKPVENNGELDTLKVNRDIPAICILLSRTALINDGEK